MSFQWSLDIQQSPFRVVSLPQESPLALSALSLSGVQETRFDLEEHCRSLEAVITHTGRSIIGYDTRYRLSILKVKSLLGCVREPPAWPSPQTNVLSGVWLGFPHCDMTMDSVHICP